MAVRVAIPDLISPSYFPLIAAIELGYCQAEGIEAQIELIFPVVRAYEALQSGEVDYVGAAAHAALYVFDGWRGCKLLAALSQGMYWFLVVSSAVRGEPGDLQAVKGLRIGAAPGPADGLRAMLVAAGIDPDSDVEIGPVPGTEEGNVSFGVTAAKALEQGAIDGFWANGMGAEMALRAGTGKLLIDARRGNVPPGAANYTFPVLATTQAKEESDPTQVSGMVRAVMAVQAALRRDPGLATAAAAPHFPDFELSVIAELIGRDAAFYDPEISEGRVKAVNQFASELGLLRAAPIAYHDLVAASARKEWRTV